MSMTFTIKANNDHPVPALQVDLTGIGLDEFKRVQLAFETVCAQGRPKLDKAEEEQRAAIRSIGGVRPVEEYDFLRKEQQVVAMGYESAARETKFFRAVFTKGDNIRKFLGALKTLQVSVPLRAGIDQQLQTAMDGLEILRNGPVNR